MSNLNIAMSQAAAAGTPKDGAWDLSYLYYDPPESLTWNISSAAYTNDLFSIAAQETNPEGLFFKPDGTKMYVVGTAGDDVNEYNLSTPWDVSTASFLQSKSVSAQDITPTGIFFKPDGTKMYIVGDSGNDVNEYNLSTPWDVSTASYLQLFSVLPQETTPTGIFFKPDGTKMYIVGQIGDDVNEYDLSTPWDVSTASFLQLFSVLAQENRPVGISFKPDGTKMYVIGMDGQDVNEYNLSTAWDVSTAVYSQLFSVFPQETVPKALFFKPDGTVFYVLGATNDTVYKYVLGGFSVSAQSTGPVDIFFKPDGTKMYIYQIPTRRVYEYDVSTAWDVSTATSVASYYFSSETSPEGLFFKPDGTKMYTLGYSLDQVYEWALSTPWSLSSVTSLGNFSVSAQDATPQDVFFKPDGTKMYILGYSGADVLEYNLSTPWQVNTATYFQNFLVNAQSNAPTSFAFSTDGTKMYITNGSSPKLAEYTLSTAWDISTASFTQSTTLPQALLNSVEGMFFKPDGSKLFMLEGGYSDIVATFSLGPQP